MKSFVFSEINNIPAIITGYSRIKVGPYLRGEKSKRNYRRYFNFERGMLGEYLDRIKISSMSGPVIDEPPLTTGADPSMVYRFNSIPHWSNYFEGLRPHRELVKVIFRKLIRPPLARMAANISKPVVGMHVRMGDFRSLQAGENFAKTGTVRTPEAYFVGLVESIRRIHGSELPVSIFTDGFRGEFRKLLAMNAVEMVEGNADIVDLILLSESKIIATSAGSTFGYWAGFLSDAPLIMHPDHIHNPIRGGSLWEGALDENDEACIRNIKSTVLP